MNSCVFSYFLQICHKVSVLLGNPKNTVITQAIETIKCFRRGSPRTVSAEDVSTNNGTIYKLSRFSERYVTEDVTSSTVTNKTPESREHVETFPEKTNAKLGLSRVE
jgi:hypothetical protein